MLFSANLSANSDKIKMKDGRKDYNANTKLNL